MYILLVTHFFPPAHNGGTENYTLGLATALRAKGHEVKVLCAEDWHDGRRGWNGVTEDSVGSVPVRRIHLNWTKADNPNHDLYDNAQVTGWLSAWLADERPDVVHVTSAYTLGVGVLRAVRHARIRLILTLTDFWFLCPRTVLLTGTGELCDGVKSSRQCRQCLLAGSSLHRLLRRVVPERSQDRIWNVIGGSSLLSRASRTRGLALDMNDRKTVLAEALALPDAILSPSLFVGEKFVEAGLCDRIRHLPHGHDLSWVSDYRGKSPSEGIRFGYMGQINHVKGVHVLVEAFRKSGLGRSARLDIWGRLNQAPEYVELLRKLIGGDERVSLCGRFERGELPVVLADIDILVVPSLWYENAPLVIHEAFATRTPVIATDLGGMAELVKHDFNGLLFERGNAADLAGWLNRCGCEPNLLTRLSAGVPRVKTVDEETNELEGLYVGRAVH